MPAVDDNPSDSPNNGGGDTITHDLTPLSDPFTPVADPLEPKPPIPPILPAPPKPPEQHGNPLPIPPILPPPSGHSGGSSSEQSETIGSRGGSGLHASEHHQSAQFTIPRGNTGSSSGSGIEDGLASAGESLQGDTRTAGNGSVSPAASSNANGPLPEVNSVALNGNGTTNIEDLLKKYGLTREQFNEKNPGFASFGPNFAIPDGDKYNIPTVNFDKYQLKNDEPTGGMPVAASTVGGQPGLGMAPGTTLADYQGAYVSKSSGALVDDDHISSQQSVSAVLKRFGEDWPEFRTDNPELAAAIGPNGDVPAGRTIHIRADKFQNVTSTGASTTAAVIPPSGGASPSPSNGTSSSSNNDVGIAGTPGPVHTDSTSGVEVVQFKAPEGATIGDIYGAAGETEAQFMADNTEYRGKGPDTKISGDQIEVRVGRETDYENKIPNYLTTAPTPAPANTLGAAGLTAGSLSTAVATPPAPAAPPPTSTSNPSTMYHTDSTSGVQVVQEKNDFSQSIPISDVYKAAGETEAQFLADNTEYHDGGHVNQGQAFEVRAGTNAQEYTANINNYVNPQPGTTGLAGSALSTAPAPLVATPAPAPAPAAAQMPSASTYSPVGAAVPPALPNEVEPSALPGLDTNPADVGVRPGLGMAPGSHLIYAPGAADDTHADSTSGALVFQETNTTGKAIPVSQVYGGNVNTENWAEFSADNTEFVKTGHINPGATYEIRADQAFPNASTYDAGKL